MSSFAGKRASSSQARSSVCSIDRAPLFALADELSLELVDEVERAAVVVGQRLLPDDRDEATQLAATAEQRGDLVGDAAVVVPRASGRAGSAQSLSAERPA